MISHSVSPHKSVAHGRRPAPPHHSGKMMMALAVLAVLLALMAGGAYWLRAKAPAPLSEQSPDAFVAQMERAAQGIPYDRTVFGGAMVVERRGNQISVTATEVPAPVCVIVGWKLVRKGLLTINGTTPLRVSAAKLSELCYQEDDGATLLWQPK
jgi:hypothetical protein